MAKKQGNTKDKIVENAIELFSKKGYTETGIREITTASGIKESSFYNHFESKQEILNHILNIYEQFINGYLYKEFDVEAFKRDVRPVEDRMMDLLIIHFPGDMGVTYTKILYIIFHEQFRNDQIRNFIIEGFVKSSDRYIQGIIDTLVRENLIWPVDSGAVSKFNLALSLFYSTIHFSALDSTPEYKGYSMPEMKKLLFQTFIKLR